MTTRVLHEDERYRVTLFRGSGDGSRLAVVLTLLISTALAALSFYTLERWAMRRRPSPPACRC